MINKYRYDYIELLIAIVGTIIGIVQIIRHQDKVGLYKKASVLFFCGVALLIISSVCNSWIAGHWDGELLIAFLTLQKTEGGGWFCRGLAYLGYIFVVFSLATLIVIFKKKFTIF